MRISGLMVVPLLLSLPVTKANAQLPPAMTVGTAASHSVSAPVSEMAVCPGATFQKGTRANFEGIDRLEFSDPDCDGFIQSDDSGAVGRHHYVQVVNTSLAFFDRKGNLLAARSRRARFGPTSPTVINTRILIYLIRWSFTIAMLIGG